MSHGGGEASVSSSPFTRFAQTVGINPAFFPFLVAAIGFGLAVLFSRLDEEGQKKWESLIHVASSVGVLFTAIGLYYSLESQARATEVANVRQQVEANNTAFIEIEQIFTEHSPKMDYLYAQLYSADPDLTQSIPERAKRDFVLEATILNTLFKVIENTLLLLEFNNETDARSSRYQEWYRLWSSWVRSPIFQSQWTKSQWFYSPATRQFLAALIAEQRAKPFAEGAVPVLSRDDLLTRS